MLNAQPQYAKENPSILPQFDNLFINLHIVAKQGHDGSIELVPTFQEIKLENEEEAQQFTTKLLDEFSCSSGRSTCPALAPFPSLSSQQGLLTSCNDIVNHQDRLALLHSITLNLEKVLPILLIERRLLSRARKLAPLANRCKASAESQSQARTEEKSTGIEADYDIGFDAFAEFENLQLEGADERGVEGVVGEEGEDVNEVYAGNWKVGKLAEGSSQTLRCTGD